MKQDWKAVQIIIVILIVTDGFKNFYNLTSETHSIGFNTSLTTSFYYFPSIVLSVCLILFIALFFITKRNRFYRLLSWSILLYGIDTILFTLVTLSPSISDYWYIMIMGLLLGVIEFIVGKKMLKN
jgi:hypothetical protein